MASDPEALKRVNKPENGNKLGIYVHPDVPGEELHAATFPAADALVRQGWTWDRPLPPAKERREARKSEPSKPAEAPKTNDKKEGETK